jgi:hypothetical protein
MSEPNEPIGDRAGHAAGRDRVPEEGASADRGHRQPKAAEVESARLLANEAKELLDRRVDEEELRRLADEYVAGGAEGDSGAFVAWIEGRKRARTRR